MDRWSGKRAIEARSDSKKGVDSVLRDRFNSSSCKVPICSDEKKPMKFTRCFDPPYKKERSVLSPCRSSLTSSQICGSSSKKQPFSQICGSSSKKQPFSQRAMDSSESSRGSEDEAERGILELSLGRDKRRVNNKLKLGKVRTQEAECSSSRIKRGFRQRFGLSKQDFHPSPSGQSTSENRRFSPLLSSGFGLDKRFSGKVDTINKRIAYGEGSSSSSAREKSVTKPPAEERRRGFNPIGSVESQRSVNRCNSRIRFSNRGSGRNGLPSITTTEMYQTETSNNLNSPLSLELFSGSLSSQDSFHSYSLDGISEILPELDRIEQDIELNYEELLIMETGLLLGGLSFYDQHRDMRLDIDSMSYEELLALEEKIGTVSTALTEEAISKCLKTTIYQMKPSSYGSINPKEDAKCSICQEEYTLGDEVGRLHCEHAYHVKCVQEWLQMKSWCPICRATPETSSSK